MKTCNGGYCSFKVLGTTMPECTYMGYCDYQCPKDGRQIQLEFPYTYPVPQCTCGTTSSIPCPLHGVIR